MTKTLKVASALLLVAAAALAWASGAAPAAPSGEIEITSPAPNHATNANTIPVTVRFRAHGNVKTVVLKLGGRDVSRYANPPQVKEGSHVFHVDLSSLPEGETALQAFAYQANEQAGHVAASAVVPLLVDRTSPTLDISSPVDGARVRTDELTVEGTAGDALSGLAGVTCNGGPASLAASSFSCGVVLVEGPNAITVRARDRAGNQRVATLHVEFNPAVVLEGSPSAGALGAVHDFDSGQPVPPGEIATDADGRRLARTLVEIAFRPDATVGQVNALLDSIDGSIESMLEGVAIIVVRIPDPGSLAALESLITTFEANPVVRFVGKAYFLELTALPSVYQGSLASRAEFVSHHLTVRAPAAWNARAALFAPASQTPLVVIADLFGDGPPNSDLDATVDPADFSTGGLAGNGHGYHVAGIIAGSYGGVADDRGLVTGMYPTHIQLRAVDMAGLPLLPLVENRIVAAVRAAPDHVVVNTSLGSGCGGLLGTIVCSETLAELNALRWIEKVRGTAAVGVPGAGLESKFVHVAAAGNSGIGNARVTSAWNAAKLLGGLDNSSGPVPNLSNVVVVENRDHESSGPSAFQPGCLNTTSSFGGDVSAIGSHLVWSFTNANSSAGFLAGTSMAAPQVTGLATYLWALDPSQSPQTVIDTLIRTAHTPSCPGGAPVVDAYDALLATDDAAALDSSGRADLAPVRSALLDIARADGREAVDNQGAPVAGDQQFDQQDVSRFLLGFGELTTIPDFDFFRADLNGDGKTGGTSEVPFDLDIDGARTLVEQEIDGVGVSFDETRLTDLDILCYYAYSPLYVGDADARTNLLGLEKCLQLRLDVVSFPDELTAGQNATLTVRAVRPDLIDPATGEPVGQPQIPLELTATGGTIDDTTGITDAGGVFRTSARLAEGSPELTIEIVARAGEGGPELARTTVTASSAGGRAIFGDGLGSVQGFALSGAFGDRELRRVKFGRHISDSLQRRSGSGGAFTTSLASYELDVTDTGASGRVQASVTSFTFDPLAFTNGQAVASALVDFGVVGGPVPYSFSGSTSGGDAVFVELFLCGGTLGGNGCVGPGGGVLGPGAYSIRATVFAVCGAGGALEECVATGSASFTLTIG